MRQRSSAGGRLSLPPDQRGAALLMLLVICIMAATSLLLNGIGSHSTASEQQTTMQTLALAKDAIIGWSASQGTTPGMLPCPEDTTLIGTSSEGQAQSSCGNLLRVGRLPWRTLKLPQLRDDAGEPLWYALSPGFRTSPINGNKIGQLTIDGAPNSAVAIIFSPGAPLVGQNRPAPTSASAPAIAQYLDGSNNTGTLSFVTTGAPGVFNDRVLAITRDNLFNTVNRRILSELRGDDATGLRKYYSANASNYPWASANAAGVPLASQLNPYMPHTVLTPLLPSATNTLMANNGWYPLITYNVTASRQQVSLTISTPTTVSCTITPDQLLCH